LSAAFTACGFGGCCPPRRPNRHHRVEPGVNPRCSAPLFAPSAERLTGESAAAHVAAPALANPTSLPVSWRTPGWKRHLRLRPGDGHHGAGAFRQVPITPGGNDASQSLPVPDALPGLPAPWTHPTHTSLSSPDDALQETSASEDAESGRILLVLPERRRWRCHGAPSDDPGSRRLPSVSGGMPQDQA
jgi:hypothetical protein